MNDYVPLSWSAPHKHDTEDYWCLACFFEDPYLAGLLDSIFRSCGPGVYRIGHWLVEFDEAGIASWA